MSEFMFGTGRGRIKASAAKRIDKIAGRHGASFVTADLPGDGPRYWFAGPNLGHPFDQAMADAVWADLEHAGLADSKGFVESIFLVRRQ